MSVTEFRYNNNILNNDDFVVVSLSLVIFLAINMVLHLLYLRSRSPEVLLASRNPITITSCCLCFLSFLMLVILCVNSNLTLTVTLVSQHYQNQTGDPRQGDL